VSAWPTNANSRRTERAVLHRILDGAQFPGARELSAQVDGARVVGGLPTFLDLAAAPSARPSSCKDGPVPLRPVVEPDDEVEGELLVWVTGGYLSGLEYAWYTDEPPSAFPDPARIRFYKI
jgi:hypothetical protein